MNILISDRVITYLHRKKAITVVVRNLGAQGRILKTSKAKDFLCILMFQDFIAIKQISQTPWDMAYTVRSVHKKHNKLVHLS